MSDLRRYADRFSALDHEVRLRILRRLRAHPDGMVVGEIQREVGYFTDEQGLGEVIHFLDAGCCPRLATDA